MVAVTGKCDCWCRMDYLTSVKCSFQCMWELVIVSSTVQSHLSSLGAVNNHNYAAHTHTVHILYTHTQAWWQSTYTPTEGWTEQFWWVSRPHRGNRLRHQPIQSTPPFVGRVSIHVFKQWLCAVHTYAPIHSSTLARRQGVLYCVLVSVWPKMCLSSLFPLPISPVLFLFLCRIIWDN